MSDGPRLPDTIQTIPEALAFWAEQTPDAPALRALDGRALSHRELLRAAAGVVARLRVLGVEPGDLAVFVLPPGFEACVAMLGGMMGAVAVPLPPAATDHELARDLERLPVRLVVAGGAEAERVREVAARLGIDAVSVEELSDPSPTGATAGAEAVAVGPDDTAVILHTSGTTGAPKRAPRSHRALVAGSRAAYRTHRVDAGRCLAAGGGAAQHLRAGESAQCRAERRKLCRRAGARPGGVRRLAGRRRGQPGRFSRQRTSASSWRWRRGRGGRRAPGNGRDCASSAPGRSRCRPHATAGGADAGRADPGHVRHERGAFHHRVGFGRR